MEFFPQVQLLPRTVPLSNDLAEIVWKSLANALAIEFGMKCQRFHSHPMLVLLQLFVAS